MKDFMVLQWCWQDPYLNGIWCCVGW